ncbi:copper ion binding [Striga asiatica]|uniref:Copper ion binding n=1 Tax=Striga asiatica TaxID=4170 RepID=A0A5A7PKQ1_STRAF|nr:copper ion binding [Striga asiatica]
MQKFGLNGRLPGNTCVTMASRIAARYISRRFSSGGKVLSEEEKAAENIYIKKMEKDKLEKLRKGPKADESPATRTGGSGSVADAKPNVGQSSSASQESLDRDKVACLVGIVGFPAVYVWYRLKNKKQPEKVQD